MREVNIQTDITPCFPLFYNMKRREQDRYKLFFTFQRPPYSNEDQVGACQILFNLIKTINKSINEFKKRFPLKSVETRGTVAFYKIDPFGVNVITLQ